jgi:hypothetical protein
MSYIIDYNYSESFKSLRIDATLATQLIFGIRFPACLMLLFLSTAHRRAQAGRSAWKEKERKKERKKEIKKERKNTSIIYGHFGNTNQLTRVT